MGEQYSGYGVKIGIFSYRKGFTKEKMAPIPKIRPHNTHSYPSPYLIPCLNPIPYPSIPVLIPISIPLCFPYPSPLSDLLFRGVLLYRSVCLSLCDLILVDYLFSLSGLGLFVVLSLRGCVFPYGGFRFVGGFVVVVGEKFPSLFLAFSEIGSGGISVWGLWVWIGLGIAGFYSGFGIVLCAK